MDAIEFIEQYAMYDRIAKRCLEEYRAESNMIRNTMPCPRGLQKKLDSLIHNTMNLKAQAANAIRKRDDVLNTLNSIPEPERSVLYARYIEQMKWEDIATRLCYTCRGIMYIHERAIKMLKARIDENENPLQT